MNFIERHWTGSNSLPKSYWLISVLLVNLLYIAGAFVMGGIFGLMYGNSPPTVSHAITTLNIIMIPVFAWSFVGTWRSATNYIQVPDKGHFWGYVVKVLVVFGVITVVVRTFTPQ